MYHKVTVGTTKRKLVPTVRKSSLRSRAPRPAMAPMCVPASVPTFLTLPAHLDAPLPMPHVLPGRRLLCARCVCRSIKERRAFESGATLTLLLNVLDAAEQRAAAVTAWGNAESPPRSTSGCSTGCGCCRWPAWSASRAPCRPLCASTGDRWSLPVPMPRLGRLSLGLGPCRARYVRVCTLSTEPRPPRAGPRQPYSSKR